MLLAFFGVTAMLHSYDIILFKMWIFFVGNLGFASSYIVGVGWFKFSHFFSFFFKLDLKYTPKFMNALYTFLFVKNLK